MRNGYGRLVPMHTSSGRAIGWDDDEVSWYEIVSADALRSSGHAVSVTAVLGETLKYWAGVVTDCKALDVRFGS